jgi:hypothetical protein
VVVLVQEALLVDVEVMQVETEVQDPDVQEDQEDVVILQTLQDQHLMLINMKDLMFQLVHKHLKQLQILLQQIQIISIVEILAAVLLTINIRSLNKNPAFTKAGFFYYL